MSFTVVPAPRELIGNHSKIDESFMAYAEVAAHSVYFDKRHLHARAIRPIRCTILLLTGVDKSNQDDHHELSTYFIYVVHHPAGNSGKRHFQYNG